MGLKPHAHPFKACSRDGPARRPCEWSGGVEGKLLAGDEEDYGEAEEEDGAGDAFRADVELVEMLVGGGRWREWEAMSPAARDWSASMAGRMLYWR